MKAGAARISVRSFSITQRRDSGAPVEMGQREYDPEIRDIADYVHNKKIDSDLAVCLYFSKEAAPLEARDDHQSGGAAPAPTTTTEPLCFRNDPIDLVVLNGLRS